MSHSPTLQIQTGDHVTLHYTTFSQDGGLIETSQNREPLAFVVGSPEIIAGIHKAVIGLTVGQKHRFPVMPELAFGQRQARYQMHVPRLGLPDRIQDGDQLETDIELIKLDVWIKQLQGEDMTLDANHPLAGETLLYEVEILSIERPGI